MSEEEKEAIYNLEKFRRIKVLYGNTFALHIEQMKQLQNNLQIVFKLIQKRQEQLEKKDKIINDMAEQLVGLAIYDNEKEDYIVSTTEKEVKQYFERKVENG